jgi:ketosteroid isomerase-like protein
MRIPATPTAFLLMLAATVATTGTALAQNAAPPPPAPAPTAEECAVWNRELSFAKAIADHDKAAFAEHVHPHAAFAAKSRRPQRGRDVIVQRWAGLIDGTDLKLHWYPRQVVVAGEGDIAYSSGPALYEAVAPREGEPKFTLGGFQSVWRKDADGTWRVLFDDGDGLPKPATDADVAAFHANRKACPAQ